MAQFRFGLFGRRHPLDVQIGEEKDAALLLHDERDPHLAGAQQVEQLLVVDFEKRDPDGHVG